MGMHLVPWTWWRHQMETFSALLTICAGNSPVPGEFPAQRPVTRSFDVFFDLRLNKRLSKQSCGWWFETPTGSLWRHCNGSKYRPWSIKGAVPWSYFRVSSVCHILFNWPLVKPYWQFKGLITVGRELRQQHPSDLLSGAGTSRERSSRDVHAGQQITRVLFP